MKTIVGDILKTSAFLESIGSLKNLKKGKSRLFGDAVRSLTRDEIAILEKQGNRCGDWSRILVSKNFQTESIHGTLFVGDCVLGLFSGDDVEVDAGVALPSGITRSTVSGSEIGDGCLISDVGVVSDYVLKPGSVVFRTDALTASGDCQFGNGLPIPVGMETGGREVLSYAEMTIPVAEAVATRRGDKAFLKAYGDFVKDYVQACRFSSGVKNRSTPSRNRLPRTGISSLLLRSTPTSRNRSPKRSIASARSVGY